MLILEIDQGSVELCAYVLNVECALCVVLSCCGGRRSRSIARRLFFALVSLLLFLVGIKTVLVDVVDDLVGDVVADALAALPEQPDLGRGYVVLDQLRDDADVVAVLLEREKGIVYAC
jgi:hypothetical protein